jgi:hypothetical protein
MSFMDKITYKGFKVGDRVSVKENESSYDRGPEITPDMIGTIKAFPPKVRKCKGPLHDRGDYFAYIEFDSTYKSGSIGMSERTYSIRGGVNICNLKRVRK